MSNDYTASIDIATGGDYVFANASNNDVIIYASAPEQRIMFGASNTSLKKAPLVISTSNVIVNARLDMVGDAFVTGKVAAYEFVGDGSKLTGVVLAVNGMGAGNGVGTGGAWFSKVASDSTSNVYLPGNTNVGIGTMDPAKALDVVGDVCISGNLGFNNRLQLQGIQLKKNTSGGFANVTSSSPLSDGFVNTTSSNIQIFPKGTTQSNYISLQDGTKTEQIRVDGKGMNARNLATFSNINFTGSLTQNGSLFVSGGGTAGGWTSASNINSVYSFSNIGIGLSNPDYALHVAGSAKIGGDLIFNNRLGLRGVCVDRRIEGTKSANLTSVNVQGLTNSTTSSNVQLYGQGIGSNNGVSFFSNVKNSSNNTIIPNMEVMRVTNQGFVGIGTTTPVAPLHVSGDSVCDGALTVANRLFSRGGICLDKSVLGNSFSLSPPSYVIAATSIIKDISMLTIIIDNVVSGTNTYSLAPTTLPMNGSIKQIINISASIATVSLPLNGVANGVLTLQSQSIKQLSWFAGMWYGF